MGLFKKKKKNEVLGRGTENTVTLLKEFPVLNCTPVSYGYTTEYAGFLTDAEAYFRSIVYKASVDDLNSDMFDFYINSKVDKMKSSATEQNVYHIQTIEHHKGLVEGELVKAKGHRWNLGDDLAVLDKVIEKYRKHKETYNIH